MLASAWTLLENEHIRIDVIYGRWSRRAQHWIDLLGTILFLMPFTTVMLWLTWPALMGSIRTGEISMNAGGLPLWPARGVLVVGFGLLFAQGLSEIVKKIAVMRASFPIRTRTPPERGRQSRGRADADGPHRPDR